MTSAILSDNFLEVLTEETLAGDVLVADHGLHRKYNGKLLVVDRNFFLFHFFWV